MKRVLSLFILILIFVLTTVFAHKVFAIESPFARPNNKIGIHILFPEELENAASLVNGNGGEWGYVTIPIQAGDRDLVKWQEFMDKAKRLKIIPILRLATEGDYFNTKVWRKPDGGDILDFANFLNSLEWPIKNRYVVIFNEPNRNDEWGGQASPLEYASILQYAQVVFKQRSGDFFVISAGLDNAMVNSNEGYNEFTFLKLMEQEIPEVFNSLDGIGSHSYPNPAFSKPPSIINQESIASFIYEQNLFEQYSGNKLPVFITETGWTADRVPDEIIASYYNFAFSNVWNNPYVVAVTPFLLRANSGGFVNFSFLKNEQPTSVYKALEIMPKIKGQPQIAESVIQPPNPSSLPQSVKNFSKSHENSQKSIEIPQGFKLFMKWLLKL